MGDADPGDLYDPRVDHGGGTTGVGARHPWLVSIGTALLVALVAAVLLPLENRTTSFAWGYYSATLLAPALGVGLLLRFQRWPWWVGLGVAAAAFAVVLGGLTMFRAALDAREREADSVPTSSTSGGDAAADDMSEEDASGPVEVAAPQAVGAWRRLGGRIDREAQAESARRMARLPDGFSMGEPGVGVYGRGPATAVLLAYAVGPEVAEEFGDDPEQGAVDFVGGATGDDSPDLVDPGPLGGGVACTDETEVRGATVCGWVDGRTVGQLTLFGVGESVDDVVPVLHLFREAATG